MTAWTQADYDRHGSAFRAIWDDFALACSQNCPITSDQVKRIARDLRGLLSEASPDPLSVARYLAVADVYSEQPHLRTYLEAKVVGLTEYVVSAMRALSKEKL
jgi:hypothetical protein